MTDTEIIAGIIDREGGYVDKANDKGGPTKYGITAATLGQWRKFGRPATRAEVRALTSAEAADIYRVRYVTGPGFLVERFAFSPLRHQIVDDGVMSGPTTAVKTLQALLGVERDGVFGAVTQAALSQSNQRALHVEYVKARACRLARIVKLDPSQAAFIEGWITRALSFLEPSHV
ncbi:glycosyl hydrolase 108 family protein [Luteitalea sp.]|uniref:glycoside hydrolase family 108 protein n=1 Tax=Luteitalea sp. TaxID=2004800 RepID=UPI0025C3BB00|nr:glycosyl hydrolase 108 family protein [Luteitalea sp.]